MARPPRPASVDNPLDRVRELAALLDEYGLSAISARWGTMRVRLERYPLPAAAARVTPAAAAPPATATPAETTTQVTIESPMVGTFYRAPSPGADPFVRDGEVVKEGQVLCVIEAMKLMNEIEARLAARVVKILVDNGTAVEYGQPLFLVEPLR